MTERVVNYVVEARKGDRPWLAMANAENQDDGEAAYQHWLNSRGRLQVQLVKRTAVITDEVLSSGQQESWRGYPQDEEYDAAAAREGMETAWEIIEGRP